MTRRRFFQRCLAIAGLMVLPAMQITGVPPIVRKKFGEGWPLPIVHTDFWFETRVIMVPREQGTGSWQITSR